MMPLSLSIHLMPIFTIISTYLSLSLNDVMTLSIFCDAVLVVVRIETQNSCYILANFSKMPTLFSQEVYLNKARQMMIPLIYTPLSDD